MAYSQKLMKKLSSFQYRNLTMHTCHMIMSDLLCVSSDCVEWAHSKMQNGLRNGLIPRTHRKCKYALISCRNYHFAHYPSIWTLPATTTQSYSIWSKLAVILKQPTISFWGLTIWVRIHCELLVPACGDRVLGWSDLDFSSKHAIACWTSTTSLSLTSQPC